MIWAARGYLYFMCILFAGIGLTALFAPPVILSQFGLLAQNSTGTAEVRCLFGGAFLSWSLLTIAALRGGPLSPGLLIAMMTTMGCIAGIRVISLIVDHAFANNIPGLIVELLALLAFWVVYRHGVAK